MRADGIIEEEEVLVQGELQDIQQVLNQYPDQQPEQGLPAENIVSEEGHQATGNCIVPYPGQFGKMVVFNDI